MIISKYRIDITSDDKTLAVRKGAKVLSVDKRGDDVYIIFMENEKEPKHETFSYDIYKESDIYKDITGKYIGDVKMFYDRYVYHIFQNKIKEGVNNE